MTAIAACPLPQNRGCDSTWRRTASACNAAAMLRSANAEDSGGLAA